MSKTLQSVLNQSFTDYEIIVVNDGSTDNGVAVVEQINDDRIKIIHQENKGVSTARNKGIEAAKAEYICFLDADDSWKEDFLNETHRLINTYSNEKGFEVKHLDNAVYHLKLDSSQEYLQKVRTSMHALQLLIKEKKLNWNDTGISKLYHDFKRYKLASCFLFIANVFNLENRLERNLLSRNPKVKYLDGYRLLLFTRLFR